MNDRPRDDLRTWWVWRREVVGLVIAALAFVVAALLVMPFGGGSSVQGTVVAFHNLG
jgi:ABC-type transporter Mla subunit MlaD